MRRSPGSVDREQRSPDGPMGPAPAIQKLGAVGHFLREGMPEGALVRRPRRGRGARPSPAASSDAARSGPGRSTTTRSSSVGTSRPTTAAAWSTSLSRVRESIDARGEDSLDGLGQCDLLDRGGRRVRAALAAQHAPLDERANDLLDEERVAAGPGLDPGASGASTGSDPSQSSSSAEECWAARGARESRSTRADHAGRYSGRVVASSRIRLPADSGARRRSVSISSAASLAGSSQCRSSTQSNVGSRRARAWIRSQK